MATAEEQQRTYFTGHRSNPLTTTRLGGRLLSGSQLLWFTYLPPPGYGVLTTTGRKTGKARRRCVRAVRDGDTVYVVALRGLRTAWMHNIAADPRVQLRIDRQTLAGRARVITDESQWAHAKDVYCEPLSRFERLEYRMHRRGRPTHTAIRELHAQWFDVGTPIAIDLIPAP